LLASASNFLPQLPQIFAAFSESLLTPTYLYIVGGTAYDGKITLYLPLFFERHSDFH
jgi:hypothetical protein